MYWSKGEQQIVKSGKTKHWIIHTISIDFGTRRFKMDKWKIWIYILYAIKLNEYFINVQMIAWNGWLHVQSWCMFTALLYSSIDGLCIHIQRSRKWEGGNKIYMWVYSHLTQSPSTCEKTWFLARVSNRLGNSEDILLTLCSKHLADFLHWGHPSLVAGP